LARRHHEYDGVPRDQYTDDEQQTDAYDGVSNAPPPLIPLNSRQLAPSVRSQILRGNVYRFIYQDFTPNATKPLFIVYSYRRMFGFGIQTEPAGRSTIRERMVSLSADGENYAKVAWESLFRLSMRAVYE
jgi:hypothetical protein